MGAGYLGCCSGKKSLRAPCLLPPPHPGSGPPLSYFSQRTGEERGFPANPRVEEPVDFLSLPRLGLLQGPMLPDALVPKALASFCDPLFFPFCEFHSIFWQMSFLGYLSCFGTLSSWVDLFFIDPSFSERQGVVTGEHWLPDEFKLEVLPRGWRRTGKAISWEALWFWEGGRTLSRPWDTKASVTSHLGICQNSEAGSLASRCWSRHGSPALTNSHSPIASSLPSLSPVPLAFPTRCAHPPGCLQPSFLELVPWASPLPRGGLKGWAELSARIPSGPFGSWFYIYPCPSLHRVWYGFMGISMRFTGTAITEACFTGETSAEPGLWRTQSGPWIKALFSPCPPPPSPSVSLLPTPKWITELWGALSLIGKAFWNSRDSWRILECPVSPLS